jgi:hypothetical protein
VFQLGVGLCRRSLGDAFDDLVNVTLEVGGRGDRLLEGFCCGIEGSAQRIDPFPGCLRSVLEDPRQQC